VSYEPMVIIVCVISLFRGSLCNKYVIFSLFLLFI